MGTDSVKFERPFDFEDRVPSSHLGIRSTRGNRSRSERGIGVRARSIRLFVENSIYSVFNVDIVGSNRTTLLNIR